MTIAPLPAELFEASAIPPVSEPAADAMSGEGGDFLGLLSLMLTEGGDPAPQETGEAEETPEHEHTPPPVAIETAPPPPPPPAVPMWLAPVATDSEGVELPSPANSQTVPPDAAPQRTAGGTVAFTARLSDTSAPVAAPAAPDVSAPPAAAPQPAKAASTPPAEPAPAASAAPARPAQNTGRSEFNGASPAPAQITEVPASPGFPEAGTACAKTEATAEGTESNRTLTAAPAVNHTQQQRPDRASEAAQSTQPAARMISHAPRTLASVQDQAYKPERATAQEPAHPSDTRLAAPPAQTEPPSQRHQPEPHTPRPLDHEQDAGEMNAPLLRRVAAPERSEESCERTAQPERATNRESASQPPGAAQPSTAPSHHAAGTAILHPPLRMDTPIAHAAPARPTMPAAALEAPAPPEAAQTSVRETREVSIVLPPSREGTASPRVELHVAERAGEVHVAVRTPDPQVRNALRSELPALVDRLEQTGYKAEIFSPHSDRAADQTHVRRGEAPADTASQDNMSRNFDEGRRERRDPTPQRPHAPANRPNPEQRSFFHEFFR